MFKNKYMYPVIGLALFGLFEFLVGLYFIILDFVIIAVILLVSGIICIVLAVFMYRRFRRIIKLQSIPHIIQLNIVQ
jgi:hypothetical protein